MVPASRVAQAAHEVRAIGQGHHALGQGHGSPAAGATCADFDIPGVGRGAEEGVEGVRTQSKFGGVCLADDEAPSRFHAFGHDAVMARHIFFQYAAAHGAGKALDTSGIFEGLRDAMQPAP
jgi:hypothetical protein